MRVVIVDDMLLLREGLARILRIAASMWWQKQRPRMAWWTSFNARNPMPSSSTSACLLRSRMRGWSAAARLREAHPRVAILVLSQFLDAAHALRLLNETPERVGYLLKDRVMDMATLTDALRRLTEGETVIDPTIVTQVMRSAAPILRSNSPNGSRTCRPSWRKGYPIRQSLTD